MLLIRVLTLPITATVAAATAGAAYLDARYNIVKDARMLWNAVSTERKLTKAGKLHCEADECSRKVNISPSSGEASQSSGTGFENQVARLNEQECIWSQAESLSWQQTHDHACRYARLFLALGVVPGQTVAFYLSNSADFVLAMLGCWAIGSSPVLINYNLTGDGLMHCLKLRQSKVLLVDGNCAIAQPLEDLRSRIESELGMQIIRLDVSHKNELASLEPSRPPDALRENVRGTDPAMLIFTSGTTGLPKLTSIDFTRSFRSTQGPLSLANMKPSPATRFYNCMPLYHGTGASIAMLCLMNGMTLCVGHKFRVSTFWEDIRASDATAFVYVGETARYLLAAPPSSGDRKHRVKLMSGNGLRPDVWRTFRDRFGIDTIIELFASSEGVFGTLNIARGDYLAAAVGHHGLLLRLLSHKRMIPVKIDPESNSDLYRSPEAPHFCERMPYSVGGEMLVQVPSTSPAESGFAGYVNNPGATGKRFVRNVFKKGDLYYRSGDALRRDDDGRWYFIDRLGDTYRWKSENVSTAEVAVALGEFPGILEANVYGVLVPGHDGRAGCAAVYIPGGIDFIQKFDWTGLVSHARSKLPKHAVPVFVRVLEGEIREGMHNMKLNKVPLREAGIDPHKMKGNDRMLWLPPGQTGYVPFEQSDFDRIVGGKAKL